MTSESKEIIYRLIWEKIQIHLQANWQTVYQGARKIDRFCLQEILGNYKSLNEIETTRDKTLFLNTWKSIIGIELLQNNRTDLKAPDATSLGRFVNKGISPDAKLGTVNMFLTILGYKDLNGFIEKNRETIDYLSTRSLNNNTTNNSIEQINKQDFSKRWRISKPLILSISFSFITFMLFYIFWLQNNNQKKQDLEKNIAQIVSNGNKIQFTVYLKIPILDTATLNLYYTSNGTAKAELIRAILNSYQQGRILKQEASTYRINRIYDFNNRNDNECSIKTNETWHLSWMDTLSKKITWLYDTTNEQTYILEKENNQWKIASNEYKGKVRKVDY